MTPGEQIQNSLLELIRDEIALVATPLVRRITELENATGEHDEGTVPSVDEIIPPVSASKYEIVFDGQGFAFVSKYISDLERNESTRYLETRAANKGQGELSNLIMEYSGAKRFVFIRTDDPTRYAVPNKIPSNAGDFKIRIKDGLRRFHSYQRGVVISGGPQVVSIRHTQFLHDTQHHRVSPPRGWS